MESNDGAAPPVDAAAALAALGADRSAMADRAMQPWWYDVALGLLVFQLVASYSLHRNWVTLLAVAVLVVGCLALKRTYERITGFWVSGLRPGATRRAVRVWSVGYAVVLAAAAGAEYGLGWHGAMAVAGVLLGIGVALTSRWWSRIYIAELRKGL
jgi:hypothetical protein